ncbi:cation channel sperm-associated auxiliary subunit gamma-like [Hemiscyllium ocellatum]|uniref:cation channel sperm-associated auxiliary subunit gamma-like n=1 Tax=Hemiscyllium ocellatum TaxID=170820 RepID=UPI0029668699|nr:cation channel sperm-associated auxiliary subunit gamma-like [Hemiscyllium ocellatum]
MAQVVEIGNLISVPNPSSPLWYLSENSPVLILGGITDRKVVLLSTSEFDDFTILEVSIDSCWIGSLSCPQGVYSATVYDAIATESMLFIRQNQLMYYFKGNFNLLLLHTPPTTHWHRVLSSVCVERLIPVYLTVNNEEKLFVIGGGKQKALTFIGTIRGSPLMHPAELLMERRLCTKLNLIFPDLGYNLGATWLAVPGVPSYSLIRYFITSWNGDFAFVTDVEEIVYAVVPNGTSKIFKRAIPVEELLSYLEFFNIPYNTEDSKSNGISFLDNCPFGVMWIKTLAPPLFYNRIQHYIAKPPWIFSEAGLYNELSLTVYQGLVHGLLWLHSTYYRPYADPVHDPTWRWWKNSLKAQHYYFYLASNKLSKGGFYVEAYDYRKHYDANINDPLPSVIYLDKSSSYEFIVYLTVSNGKSSVEYDINQVWMATHVSSPQYILVNLERKEIVHRGSLMYKVTVKDREYYAKQSLSGENLVVLTVTIKVVNSDLVCFQEFNNNIVMQGGALLKVYVGCPPGNRLAFDISYTLQYSTQKNNIYFDCIEPNVEIPCFYYEIPFYPFFLIQDMVTGKSDRFWGKYTFKVIGGGPYTESNIRMFSEEEILMFNSLNYRWICQKYSPCSDVPADGLKGPEYFLVIEVSNRGIDTSTYCDYRLEFLIHLHGLPLNPYRGLVLMLTTLSILWFILSSFIILRCYLNWFEKRVKLSSAADPMVLPSRIGM